MVEYFCEKCNYKTTDKYNYGKHLNAKSHKGEKRKPRSDKVCLDKCPMCDFVTKGRGDVYKEHILTMHSTEQEQKEQFTYYCTLCDVGTFNKFTYNTHLKTKGHNQIVKAVNQELAKRQSNPNEMESFKPSFSNRSFDSLL